MSGHDPHTGTTFGLWPTEEGFLFPAPKTSCCGAAQGSGSVYAGGAGDWGEREKTSVAAGARDLLAQQKFFSFSPACRSKLSDSK